MITILDLDPEVLTWIAMAIGAVGLAYGEFRRDRDQRTELLDLAQRVAKLESLTDQDTSMELAQRIAKLEARIDYQGVKATVRRPDGKFGKVT